MVSPAALPPPTPAMDLPLLKGVSRSFYLTIRLLPPALRAPIAVGYLLARATDTVADTAAAPQAERLALLRDMAQAIGTPESGRLGQSGGTSGSSASALPAGMAQFATHQSDPHEKALIHAWPDCLALLTQLNVDDQASVRWVLQHITQGQMADLSRFAEPGQALATEAQLDHYTWQVAGCVGEFWTELCERHLPGFARLPSTSLRPLGRHYGMGLQRLNILRDAGADLAAGRCYLPAEQLSRLGCSPAALAQAQHRGDAQALAALTPLFNAYVAQTHAQLADGIAYSSALTSRRLRLASALPALLGARTLALLAQAGTRAWLEPVKMPRREVHALLWRLLLRGVSGAAIQREFDRLSPPAPVLSARSQAKIVP